MAVTRSLNHINLTKRFVIMIRAFTISFDFEGKTYLALASIKTENSNETMYSIRLYNTSLYRYFPDGVLKYSNKETECPVKAGHPLTKPLFDCICESVDAHLKIAQQYE